jgi:hypothetical protein
MRAAIVVAVSIIGLPGAAHAWVQRVDANNGNVKVAWQKSCVPVTIYLAGFERSPDRQDLGLDGIVKSVVAAAHAWSTDAVQCGSGGAPFLEIVPTLAPLDTAPPQATYDAKNSIIFRTNGSWPWSDDALAHTSVWWAPDGHILDADIEINAIDPTLRWMSLDPGVLPPATPHVENGARFVDLQSVLTHEFGHFLGLMHSCYRPEDGAHLLEDDGTPAPDCTVAPADLEASVMYPAVDPGSAVKRTLAPQDVDAACTIYAASKVHDACALDTPPAGCAVAPPARRASIASRAGLGGLSGLAGLAALAARRARVSARRRARS